MYRHASDPEFPQVSSNYKAISGYSASNTRRFLSRYASQESRYNSFRTEISEQWSYILFRASKTTLTESGKFVTHCCGSSTNHLFRLQFNPAIFMFLQFNVTKKIHSRSSHSSSFRDAPIRTNESHNSFWFSGERTKSPYVCKETPYLCLFGRFVSMDIYSSPA